MTTIRRALIPVRWLWAHLADEGEGQDAADDSAKPAADDPEPPPHTDRG